MRFAEPANDIPRRSLPQTPHPGVIEDSNSLMLGLAKTTQSKRMRLPNLKGLWCFGFVMIELSTFE